MAMTVTVTVTMTVNETQFIIHNDYNSFAIDEIYDYILQ